MPEIDDDTFGRALVAFGAVFDRSADRNAIRTPAALRAAFEAVGNVPATVDQMAAMIADLDGYIARRAREIAQPMVRAAQDQASAQVGAAQRETERQRDLVTELGRRLGPADQQVEQIRDARDRLAAALGHLSPLGLPLSGLVDEAVSKLGQVASA